MNPDLYQYGVYRKIDCKYAPEGSGVCDGGRETFHEMLPYCSKEIENYFGVHANDLHKLRNKD